MTEKKRRPVNSRTRRRREELKRQKKLRLLFGELGVMIVVLIIAFIIWGDGEKDKDKTDKKNDTLTEASGEKNDKDNADKKDEKETGDKGKKEDETTEDDKKADMPDFSEYLNKGADVKIPEQTNFSEYSREKVPFGFGEEVDGDNRPVGCSWYDKKFGQFACDFIHPKSKYVFLTFDEGYEYGYTGTILDILKEKNVKAVFFITLPYAQQNPELVKRMIDEGHVVGNHSSTHPSGGLQQYSAEEMKEDIDAVTKYVKENFGYDMYLFRFPEGSFSEQALAVVQSLGYRSVFWSFAYADWDPNNQPDITSSLKNATDKLHGGAIYLLHAESETNTKMLADFIDAIRKKGMDIGYYSKTE